MTKLYKNSRDVTINIEIGLVFVLENSLVYIVKLQTKTFQDAFVSLLFQNEH